MMNPTTSQASESTNNPNNNTKLDEITGEYVFKDGEPYEKTPRVAPKKKKKGKVKKRNK